jgi:hypothetical protein
MEERLQISLPQADQCRSRACLLNAGMQRGASCWSLSQERRQLLAIDAHPLPEMDLLRHECAQHAPARQRDARDLQIRRYAPEHLLSQRNKPLAAHTEERTRRHGQAHVHIKPPANVAYRAVAKADEKQRPHRFGQEDRSPSQRQRYQA